MDVQPAAKPVAIAVRPANLPRRGFKGKRLRSARSRAYADFPGRAALRPPCVFEGPINGQCFRAYVEQLLVPVLKPGDIVVMDNLGSHKSATIRQMIQAVGARLWYLPPYSPDLNPPNRPSPRSSIGCATRRSERLTRHRGTSATSSPPSNLANAQTTL
jgi:hypothetical protein